MRLQGPRRAARGTSSGPDAPLVMLAGGTRGDVQPFLALALGVRKAGIPVLIAAAPRFRALVEERGVRFFPLAGNPSDLMEEGAAMAASLTGGPLRGIEATLRFLRTAPPVYGRMLDSASRACRGARAIVVGLASIWGFSIGEAERIPCVACLVQPFGRTETFPSALVPMRASLGTGYNALSYRVVEQAIWLPWRQTINRWRRGLGLRDLPLLGPWRRLYARGFPCLYGFSAAVVPPPADWPSDHLVTGYWFLHEDDRWVPPQDLAGFLSSGPPPIYVGFGSTSGSLGVEGLKVLERAVNLSGVRAVVSLGGGPAGRLPATMRTSGAGPRSMIVVDEVPHAWLFRRVAAVMHHGGAGTTGEAVRAGIPSLIVPRASDQYFWSWRLERLGAGLRVNPRALTDRRQLARLLALAVSDEGLQQRARQLGERVRAESGVSEAVAALLPLVEQAGKRGWPGQQPRSLLPSNTGRPD